ncbi:hypothetical protein L873DRAFT_1805459 [Choiromyces venosus 120613-1]|uniref:Uncharacterized protein n=1 Tax=Choiromyces venosus 120613-1 TaxID=1336337 RepID=A0A3N4JQ36_9PEZI|nr:hypothetical protein L873DRAFT_1805459 [Choiromyces venosus 120613-1]
MRPAHPAHIQQTSDPAQPSATHTQTRRGLKDHFCIIFGGEAFSDSYSHSRAHGRDLLYGGYSYSALGT